MQRDQIGMWTRQNILEQIPAMGNEPSNLQKHCVLIRFHFFDPIVVDEEKSETRSSNKKGLNAFCFHSLISWRIWMTNDGKWNPTPVMKFHTSLSYLLNVRKFFING